MTMKKALLFLTSAVLLMAGCAKVENEIAPEKGMHQVTLKAYVPEETRVSINNAGVFSWQVDDKISVVGDDEFTYTFTTAGSGSSVTFDGTLPEGVNVGQYAFYPASEGGEEGSYVDGDEISFFMPTEYTYVQDAAFMPMLGEISSEGAAFKAVGGVLKLIIYNVPADAARLVFTARNKVVTGNFPVSNGVISAEDQEADDYVHIVFDGKRNDNMVFYIPLPTGTINGFELGFMTASNTDIEGASKTTTATLNVTRNKMIIAPALNMASAEEVVLWSEDFSQYDADDVPNGEEGVGYNDAVITYACAGSSTKVYDANLAKGEAPELLLGQKNNNVNGVFEASGIPTAGASSAVLTFYTNNKSLSRAQLSSPTEGITVGTGSYTGTEAPFVFSYPISIADNVTSFTLTLTNTTTSNIRIDNIILKATVGSAPVPPTITSNKDSETISAGSLNASINGVTLVNALDNLGITATTDAEWLSVAFTEGSFETGAKLTATANSYNHDSEARTATVTLKATGVTKTVTFKQNPSIVENPASLTAEPRDKTFSISWTGDSKVASYAAFYSSTELADPSEGTALSISNEGTAYTAIPTETLINGTTYYVYVRVATLASTYADKYAIASGWTAATVVPIGIHGSVDSPYPMADAIVVMDGLEVNVPTVDFYYVAGTLDQAPSYYGNGQLTFTFVDEDENSIKAFNCLGLNGANFSSKSDLKAGDQVVIYGNLEKYVNSANQVTYEIVNGYLAKLTPAETEGGIKPDSNGNCFNITSYGSIPTGWSANGVDTGSYLKVNAGGSLVSPAYNIEGYATAVVSIKVAKFGTGTNPAATLSVSYDGGNTWTETKTLTAPTSSSYLNAQTLQLSGDFTKNVVIKLENPTGNAALRVQNYSFKVTK